MTAVNFESSGVQKEALDNLVRQGNVQGKALDGDSETLERQVYQQIGGVGEGGDAAEIAAKKEQELRSLIGQRRGIDKDGDGQVDSEVGFSEKKRFLRKPGLVITEYAFSTDPVQAQARQAELQAQWTADQADRAGLGTVAAAPAPTATAEPAGTTDKVSAQRTANTEYLKKPIEDKFGDPKRDMVTGSPGALAFDASLPADQEMSAAGAAAFKAGKAMGMTDEAAKVYVRDVLAEYPDNAKGVLSRVNSDFTNDQQAGTRRTGPVDQYENPEAYARLRVGTKKEDVEAFEEGWSEEAPEGSAVDKWAAVMGADSNVRGDEYLDGLFEGSSKGVSAREVGEIGGEGVYATKDRREEVGKIADTIREERLADLRQDLGLEKDADLDAERKKVEEYLAKTDLSETDRKNYEAQLKKLDERRAQIDADIQDAIANPAKLQRMSDGRFKASKHEKAAAAKARSEGEETDYSKVRKGAEEFSFWTGKAKEAFGYVQQGIEFFQKQADRMAKGLEKIGEQVAGQMGELLKEATSREAPPEFIKGGTEFNPAEVTEGTARSALQRGAVAGTAPEAQPGNMLAKANHVEQPGPDGKKKKKRTFDLEDLRSQVQAQRAIDRYTV